MPPYLSAWAWFTPRDHRSFLLKLVFEQARLTQREEQDGQRFISGGSINQPVAGVGLCQTFPWGSRGSLRGCFSKSEFAAWGLSTNPWPRSGSKKGLGTWKGHAGPSGSGGEQPAGRCAVPSSLLPALLELVCQTSVHEVAWGCSEGRTAPSEEVPGV